MFNLSFHGSHNATIAISKDDTVLECIEIERFISKKNAALFYYESPSISFVTACIKQIEKYFREKYQVEKYNTIVWNAIDLQKIDLKKIFSYDNLVYYPHHEAHACSAYYQSDYKEAIIISFDGGSDEGFFNVYLARGNNDMIKIYSGNKDYAISYMIPAHFIKEIKREKNIYDGNLVYAGKLMGYVGFGEFNSDMASKLRKFYNSNTYDNIVHAVDRFVDLFSDYGIHNWECYFSDKDGKDIATTNQIIFEELFYEEIYPILKKYPKLPTIITGGCGLNIINNTKLSKDREIFVTPNPNDVGLALGLLCKLIKPSKAVDSTYIGPPLWDQHEIPKYLNERKYTDLNIKKIAKEIISGSVIGIARGRSEHGPRALGNRSIICNATISYMKDYLNKHIKNRESFRPFSPVVRLEDVSKYFEWDGESRWMTFCPNVKEEYKELLSSITHVDGTARVQTVTKNQNEFLYNLLTEIDDLTGNAVLLNTSFNIAGKPILNTCKEAFWMLDNKNLSAIIIEDYYFPKVTERL